MSPPPRLRDLIICPAEEADKQAVLDIWESASRQAHAFLGEAILADQRSLVAYTYFASTEIWVAKMSAEVSTKEQEEEQGGVRGFIGLLPAEKGKAYVAGLFVKPAQQNRGIGRALLAYVQQFASALEVEVYAGNARALNFYKHYGFIEVERKTLYEGGQTWPVVRLCLTCV